MPSKPKTNYATEAGKSNKRDCFMSPSYALNPLLPYLLKEWTIWESAAGEGLLTGALEINGYQVIATELTHGVDYFAYEPPVYDCQVTNPPFSRKYQWLKRAYELGKPFALLMPSDALFAATAIRLFEQHGIEVLIPRQRIDFKTPDLGWEGSGAQFSSSWFCYGFNIGKHITYCELNKPKRKHSKTDGRLIHNPERAIVPEVVQTALF